MENKKESKSNNYHDNSTTNKTTEQLSLALPTEANVNQYLAAQQHLETQKQFYEQLYINNSTSKSSLQYGQQNQHSYQSFNIAPSTRSTQLPINSTSFSTTQTIATDAKNGHSYADVFPIGNELSELLTIQRNSGKQKETLKDAPRFPYQPNNNLYFKHQNNEEIESLLNDQNYLDFNLIGANSQWQSNELMNSSTHPSDPKKQEKKDSNIIKRSESDVFGELLLLAQNRIHITHVPTTPLENNTQMLRNEDGNRFIPDNINQINSQYNEYYFHGFPNTQNQRKRNFKLEVIQQPARARMCGYGNKDRRPITPPPIIKLIVTSEDGYLVDPESFDTSFMILICDSCQQELGQNTESINEVSPQLVKFSGNKESPVFKMRNLVGSSVSSATKLYDLEGNLGIYFIFQDISFRTEGHFKLKLSLVDIGSQFSHTVNTTSVSEVKSTVYTDIFTVYTAKNFPGVVESTPLTQCFSRQGIKIPFRRDIGKKNTEKKNSTSKDTE